MRLFFFFSLCMLLVACKNEIHPELDKADAMLVSSPDSSLVLLEKLKDEYPFMNEADRAYFGLLYYRALDGNRMSIKNNPQLEFSFNYYERRGQKHNLAYCHFYKARALVTERDYTGATKNLLKAEDLASKCDDANLSGKIYFSFAQIYAYQLHYEQSIDYYNKSLVNFEKANDSINIAKVYIMMNEIYMCMYKFDTGIEHGKKALKCTSDSIMIGDAYNAIGIAYYFHKGMDSAKLDSARYYISKSLDYPYYDTNLSMRIYNMGRTHYTSGNRDSAEYYLNKALEHPIDIYFEWEVYTLLMKIATEKKENEKIKPYMERIQECRDSISKLDTQTDIEVVKQIHETNKQTDEIKYHRIILFAGAIFLLLIGLTITYVLYQRAKHRQSTAEKYKIKMKEKHELLIKKHEQLERTREMQVSEIKNELQNRRTELAEIWRKSNFEEREKITRIIYNKVFDYENEAVFLERMNRLLNNLPNKLLDEYPNITFKEILWCCLFILKVPTNDILSILEYKQSSFYKFKQRLGNKLGYTAMKDLEEMLYKKVEL